MPDVWVSCIGQWKTFLCRKKKQPGCPANQQLSINQATSNARKHGLQGYHELLKELDHSELIIKQFKCNVDLFKEMEHSSASRSSTNIRNISSVTSLHEKNLGLDAFKAYSNITY